MNRSNLIFVLCAGIVALAMSAVTSLGSRELRGGLACNNCTQSANALSCSAGQAVAGAVCSATTWPGNESDCPGTQGKKCIFSQTSVNHCQPQPDQPCPTGKLYRCLGGHWVVVSGTTMCGNKASCTQNNG